MSSDKDLEARAKTLAAEVVDEEGLASLSFNYCRINFLLSAEAIYHPRATLPFFSIPIKISFPNDKTIDKYLTYDADKEVFIHMLIEDSEMKEHYPEGFKKAESDKANYYSKWDSYRMDVSKTFSVIFNSGMVSRMEHQQEIEPEK